MKPPIITAVEAIDSTTIRIAWQDGSASSINLAELINKPAFAPVRDPAAFARVSVGLWGHSIAWDDELDLGADALWRMAKEQTGDFFPAAEFRDWRRRNGLSLSAAAKALGLSRRMVVYYDSGEKPIPRLVGLACKGHEAQKLAA